MSKKQLAQALSLLRRFQGQGDDCNRTVYSGRVLVLQILEGCLTNSKIMKESLDAIGDGSECHIVLQWCSHLVQSYKEFFISPLHSAGDETPTLGHSHINRSTEEEHLSIAFTWWFLSKLIWLLSRPECSPLHTKGVDSCTELMRVVKARDLFHFSELVSEIVHAIAELFHINEDLYEGKTGRVLEKFRVDVDTVRKSLQDPEKEDQNVDAATITIPCLEVFSVEVCESLQLNLVRILRSLVEDGFIGDTHLSNIMWGAMCCHVELCDIEMKKESLHIIYELLLLKGLPEQNILDYFISCITGLIELLSSPNHSEADKRELLPLEEISATVIHGVCVADCSKALSFVHISDFQLQSILYKICQILQKNGFHSMQLQVLKNSTCDLISHGLDVLNTGVANEYDPTLVNKEVFSTLRKELGNESLSSHLVKPLIKLLLFDLRDLYGMSAETAGGTSTEKPESTVSTQYKRKRKADDQNKKREKQPYRHHKLRSKLKSFVTGLQDPKQERHAEILEGIHTVITVVLVSIQTCLDKDSSRNIGCHLPESLASLTSWLPHDLLDNLMETFKLILQYSHHWRPSELSQNILCIVKTLVNILHMQDWTELEDKMCWMLSLPWLQNDLSWIDMKPVDSKTVNKISQEISDKLDTEVKRECLRGLSLLPKDVVPQWRVHVFRQACTDSDLLVKKEAVECLPMVIVHLGPNANHLVHDLLRPMVDEKCPQIQEAVVSISGILACVICRKAVLRKERNIDGFTVNSHKIQCLSCDSMQDKDGCKTSKERPKFVDPNMFSPFLNLINTDNTVLKQNMMQYSLPRMFGHIGIRCNNAATMEMLKTCLTLIEDPDYHVRVNFSKIIGSLIGDINSDTNPVIVEKLKEVLEKAKAEQNMRLQETVILTIAQIGRVAEDELLLVVIISLLENMLSKVPIIAAVAYQQLKSVAQFKKMKTQNLFMNSRQQICKFLVEAMLDSQTTPGSRTAGEIITDVSNVLDFKDCKTFLKAASKCMIPQLVSKATPEASSLLKMIATMLDLPSRMKLLLDNNQYVFSYLVRFCQTGEMEKAILFLQKETDLEFAEFLRINFQMVHQELLLHLSTHYNKVFNGLRHLSSYDNTYSGPKDINTQELMANYLQPRLLGVIAFFDNQLQNANVPITEKKLTMQSLTSIILLMGKKHIGTIRHKVVNTLRIGLQFKDQQFMEINCRAWNCFIRSLELPVLGLMMSQIIATLLPLIESLPKQIAGIINYIIVENRKALCDHFHEIYFLPELPDLDDANAVLKQYTEQETSSQSDLGTRLRHSIKGVLHESLDIRLHALSKLRNLLRKEKDELHIYIMGNETTDPVISQLVSVLLKGCQDSDGRAQCLYAECIGELGVIDPGRLELLTNNPKEELAKFHSSIEDDNFAVGLINEVVTAFLAAPESRIQDCAAYALQELLKIYKIREPSAEVSCKLWGRFPEHVQQILVPLLSSKYIVNKRDFSNLTHPIYCSSEKTQRFQDWVNTWTGYLSSKVQQEKAKDVFSACEAMIKHFVNISLYILPYVVFQVIQDGSKEDIQQICNEITEVLNQTSLRKTDVKNKHISNSHHLSAQTVFSVLDYLTKWKRYQAQAYPAARGLQPSYLSDPKYTAVDKFLEMIPQNLLSDACHCCKAYTRSLMHLEQFLSSKKQNVQNHLDVMQRLYMAMDEPDGVVGVAAIRQAQPSLMEQILTHESLAQHQDAQACYERAIQSEAEDVSYHQGLLHSLLEIGQETQALLHATGAIAEKREWAPQLSSYMVEAAWKLGDWEKLETFIESEKKTTGNWSVGIGNILIGAKNMKKDEFYEKLKIVRREQIGPLSAASMESGSYLRGYEYILRLHMLNEIEESCRILMNIRDSDDDSEPRQTVEELLFRWENRFNMVQCSFRTQEPILTMRRTLFTLVQKVTDMDLEQEIGRWWLSSARIARKAGYLQTAYSSILQASDYNLPEFFIEKAKWLRHKGDPEQALVCLERGMMTHFGTFEQVLADKSEQATNKQKSYAKALMLFSRYTEETSNLESNEILKLYRKVNQVYPDWEDGHFYIGKYYDKIITTLIEDKDKPDPAKQWEVVVYVVKHYWRSMMYGNQFIYQSLPRLLSLWLEFGASAHVLEKKEQANLAKGQQRSQKLAKMRTTLVKLNEEISRMGRELAAYQLYTAFSQLISRICHTEPQVFQQLKELIARIFVQFPQQSVWMMMAVSKSSYQMRVQRCQDIFATAKLMDPSLKKFIHDTTKLTERLLELCEKDIKGVVTLSLTTHFRPLKRLLEDSEFSQILLPLQSAMTVTLPSTPRGHEADHNVFPNNQVYISSFEETIEILPSMARPKKITMIGSDGKMYIMMCKPNDDMRKDCRLMEFNAIVNKFLHKNPEARKRELYIRTYSVVPLNEYCGLVEWVNNTHGFRHILLKIYRERGIDVKGSRLQALTPSLHSSLDEKRKAFKEKLLPLFPPIFREWFLRIFPDPTSWYNGRLKYARTSAVMSMVGYILGLGDRHGENILYDSTNGDCVHVDFNCLFNKGENFEWAERVPFRLTHNMEDAMGPLGKEGIFRRACEVTLRVMRDQLDPLMSVLKPFIYDPLVEWNTKKGQRPIPTAESGEIANDQAMYHVQNIESRMKGIQRGKANNKPRSVALSVEGHVNYLLQEATNIDNLCQMYVGWAAYL